MTGPLRQLAALAAVFASARAGELLGLVASPWSAEARARGEALARRTREERLAALADAISAPRERQADRAGALRLIRPDVSQVDGASALQPATLVAIPLPGLDGAPRARPAS